MPPECRNELVHRERRGQLSSSERLALEAHLEGCESCRLSRDVGADFDAEGELRTDDGALIERLARRATAQKRGREPKRARAALLLAAAISSLLAAVASAKSLGWFASADEPATVAMPASGSAPQARALEAREAQRPATSASVSSGASALAPLVPPPRPASAPARPASSAASAASAAQLFRKANDARRAGDNAQAVRLYQSLQREYPASAEASLSSVSLGRLLQSQGSSAGALEQFNRYLTAVPGGPLSAEALYGKARSLAALGRTDAERQTWRELLQRFPTCPYRDSALRRLDELK